MPVEGLVKVEYPESPERCERLIDGVQCTFKRIPGEKCCPLHAIGYEKRKKQESIRNYNLTKWKDQVNRFSDNTQIKSLREETGILRMLLESLLNRYTSEEDLLMIMPKILSLTDRLEKMVGTLHKLEASLGQLLDKQQIVQLAMEISQIISEYVSDPDVLEKIAAAISKTIDRIGQNDV